MIDYVAFVLHAIREAIEVSAQQSDPHRLIQYDDDDDDDDDVQCRPSASIVLLTVIPRFSEIQRILTRYRIETRSLTCIFMTGVKFVTYRNETF